MATRGGIGQDVKPADDKVHAVAEAVKDDFVAKSGVTAAEYKPVSYKTQVVAGTNYFIKIHLGGDSYAHLRVYQALPHTKQPPQLTCFQVGKGVDDSIEYFE